MDRGIGHGFHEAFAFCRQSLIKQDSGLVFCRMSFLCMRSVQYIGLRRNSNSSVKRIKPWFKPLVGGLGQTIGSLGLNPFERRKSRRV